MTHRLNGNIKIISNWFKELDILKSRGDREYHGQFNRVSHELSVMRDIAASQVKVLEDLQEAYGTGAGSSAAKAIGVHGPETGLEIRLLYRARRTAKARYKQWTALMKEFEDLKIEVRSRSRPRN